MNGGSIRHGRANPTKLMADFEDATGDIPLGVNPHEVLHAIIADIQDSYALAMHKQGIKFVDRTLIHATVNDYIANHYGED